MLKQINQVEIENVIKEVIMCNELEIVFDTDVSISIENIKSNEARSYLNEIKRRLGELGYTVGLCTLGSYGNRGMFASNSINNISFTFLLE